MKVHAASLAITVAGLGVGVGCPQMRDDDFLRRAAGVGAGGTASGSAGATGGDGLGVSGAGGGTCDAGSNGCVADTVFVDSAGAAGSAGSSSSVPADGGADAQPGSGGCGLDEVMGPNGQCYFAEAGVSTWSEARASCQSRGAGWDLVSIGDAEENAFVLSITAYEAWIGATDVATEGAWSWVDEDAPFFEVGAADSARFTNWTDGEPNDYDGSDCLRLLTTGQWADWPCDSPLGHVCQRQPP